MSVHNAYQAQEAKVNLPLPISRYAGQTNSASMAFFDGTKAMLDALRLMPPDELASAFTASNRQHLVALLIRGQELRDERRLNDVQHLLKAYGAEQKEIAAFIFDLPAIDSNSGLAVDADQGKLEGAFFHPLPTSQDIHWPNYKITHCETNRPIKRIEYNALNPDEQDDYYSVRFLELKDRFGNTATIRSDDRHFMAELIRRNILSGNHNFNWRYLTEIYFDQNTLTTGKLYEYRDVVIEAMRQLYEETRHPIYAPRILTQAEWGGILGAEHLLIAHVQYLAIHCQPSDLTNPICNEYVAQMITLIHGFLSGRPNNLHRVINDDVILESYLDANGEPISIASHARDEDGKLQWEYRCVNNPTPTDLRLYLEHTICPQALDVLERAVALQAERLASKQPLAPPVTSEDPTNI